MRSLAVALAGLFLASACVASAPAPPAPERPALLTVVVLGPAATRSLAGAQVCAAPPTGAERCATTDGGGSAALALRPGGYLLRVRPPAGERLALARQALEMATWDNTTVVVLSGEARIGGHVRGPGRTPVPGASVCAHPAADEPATCELTAADGAYLIKARPTAYKLEVNGPASLHLVRQWARGRAFSDEADLIDVRTGDASGVDVDLVAGVVLRGLVGDDGGVPLPDAQVCTKTLAAPLPWECERTAKDGRYGAVRDPGRYWVWVIPPSGARLVAQWYERALDGFGAAALDLGADRALDFALEAGPQIRGVVRTDDGAPVGNAFVCVDTPFPTGRICRETARDGAYAVTVRPETYALQVVPPPASDAVGAWWSGKRTWVEADRVVLGAVDVVVDVTLRRGVRVSGTVRDAGGVALEGATVSFNDDVGVVAAAATDGAGRYVVALPTGRYRFQVFAPFASSLVSTEPTDIDVRGPQVRDVTLADAGV